MFGYFPSLEANVVKKFREAHKQFKEITYVYTMQAKVVQAIGLEANGVAILHKPEALVGDEPSIVVWDRQLTLVNFV